MRRYFWIGLFSLMVLYCLYYFFFIDNVALNVSLRVKHIGKFAFILAAYLAGAFFLRRQEPAWLLGVWRWVYGCLVLVLILFGIFDWVVARSSMDVRIIAYDLQELLISPILYVGIGLLGRFGPRS